jgi:signal transduction histidine kinase/HAMP domain-containing protein
MKLRDLGIGVQLRVGLGVILAMVVVLAAVAWYQTNILWQEAKGLYDHPLAVKRAVGDLKADILSAHWGMENLFLAKDPKDHDRIIQIIQQSEADAEKQLAVLYERYLGPRTDVDHVAQDFAQCRANREQVIRLMREGKAAEADALNIHKSAGLASRHIAEILAHIQDLTDFSHGSALAFYEKALDRRILLRIELVMLAAGILLLAFGVSYILLRNIRSPLKELIRAAAQYRQGHMDARSGYASANEFGDLSASFNELARTIQTEMAVRESVSRIAEVMLREDEWARFSHELLKALMAHTGSQMAAIYLRSPDKACFEHAASIGLSGQARLSFAAAPGEGEFGQALSTGKPQHIAHIPADTPFTFSAVVGDFRPSDILTLPVLSGKEVIAVISLASLHPYSPQALRLTEDILKTLSARVNGVLAFLETRELARKLETQNQELEAQKKELAVQADELTEQNVELEAQKRQLDEASRLKSRFLSNMSHELRTPLNSVIALAGVLARRLIHTIPEEEYSYIEIIERNGKNLLGLINDLLDLARIEAGREEIRVSRFSIAALVDEVVETLNPQAKEKGIALKNEVPQTLPPLTSDPDKCRHILMNLVGNAIKFTDKGRVAIASNMSSDRLRISVADTGIGIPEDQLPHIFDEFRQADDGASRKYGGTGLGLSIANKYAQLLRAEISVESTPGKGSTFSLDLPLGLGASAAEDGLERRCPGPDLLPAGRGQSILLVEDSEPAVIQMSDMLQAEGYRIEAARNGREALERIKEHVPDAMILDLMMPEVDGFEVLRQIRNEERTAHIPVLILTARHVTSEELSFLKGNRIHQLIQKGDVSKAELLRAVGRMVAKA